MERGDSPLSAPQGGLAATVFEHFCVFVSEHFEGVPFM
jgi:hypothetical protein